MRYVAQRSVETPTYEMVTDLITKYAYALDDGNIDLWPSFFTDSALYHVTTRENYDQNLPIGIIRCVGRGMMIDRVKAFHTANIYEPHCYNHLVGPATMRAARTPEAVASAATFRSSGQWKTAGWSYLPRANIWTRSFSTAVLRN
jgi:anthranilate 1,2-dioxygenase small subunit